MAARYQLGCAKLFRFSRTLFTKEDGAPYTFYLADKLEDLKEIIERGAGELADSPEDAAFVLTENISDKKGCLPLEFIVDCVKKNTFLDPKKYSGIQQEKPRVEDQPGTSASRHVLNDIVHAIVVVVVVVEVVVVVVVVVEVVAVGVVAVVVPLSTESPCAR
ncbi:hypothetical protein ElyMa_005841600 [Elysia marginata]|uniref:BRCT domain-containing protein n=1 Tax=Elysia marginata TaxID=1093978 RepID=A0AAV4FXC1_9GAST|nr:hypothetical protein ElyMa_005841600 [Elysia marginata]